MSETAKTPYDEGFTEIAENVFIGKGEVVVVGQPWDGEDENDPAAHNCDAMGCGQWHVLHRAPLKSDIVALPSARAATTEGGTTT